MNTEITDEEIKSVFMEMDLFKSPGPDGWNAYFFKGLWGSIGNDVCSAIKHVFADLNIKGGLNATNICLVPKVPNPR